MSDQSFHLWIPQSVEPVSTGNANRYTIFLAHNDRRGSRVQPIKWRANPESRRHHQPCRIGRPGEDNLVSHTADAEARPVKPGRETVISSVAGECEIVKDGGAGKEARSIAVAFRVHSNAVATVIIRTAGLFDPQLPAGAVEFGDEEIIQSPAGQVGAAERGCAGKPAGKIAVARRIRRNDAAAVIRASIHLLRPKGVARAAVFGQKVGGAWIVGEREGAEGRGAGEHAGYKAVTRRVHGDGVAGIKIRAAGAFGPEQLPIAVVSGDENVRAVGARIVRQGNTAEGGGRAFEVNRDGAVAGRVRGDRAAGVEAHAAGLFGPEQVAVGVVFGDEDIGAAEVIEDVVAEGGLAGEGTGNITIAGGVRGDSQRIIIESAAAGLARPERVAFAVVLGVETIVTPTAGEGGLAEIGHVVKSAGDVTVAAGVRGDAAAEIIEAAARLGDPAKGRRLGLGGCQREENDC